MPVSKVDTMVLHGAREPENEDQFWFWAYDLRTMKVFDSFGSNYDIAGNLKAAGVVTALPKNVSWDDAPCPKMDNEYSQFWIFFDTEAQMRQWISELVQYTEWLEDAARFIRLAERYKEINA